MRHIALSLLIALVLLPAARADKRAETVHSLYRRGADSTAVVTFYVETERGKAKRTVCGTVVSKEGLIIVDGDYFPTNLPIDSFVEFKIAPEGDDAKPTGGAYLGKDEEAGVAFIQAEPAEGEALTWTPVTFVDDADIEPGMELVSVKIMPKDVAYAKAVSMGMVAAVIENPKPVYLYNEMTMGPHTSLHPTLGAPVFTMDGDAIGLIGRKKVGKDGVLKFAGRSIRRPGPKAYSVLPASRFVELIADPPRGVVVAKKPWLGVGGLTKVTEDLAGFLGLPEDASGLVIGQIIEGGPADKAGLKPEDVILEIDGKSLEVEEESIMDTFRERVHEHEIGQTVPLTVWRNNEETTVKVTLIAAPREAGEAPRYFVKDVGFTGRELVLSDRLDAKLPRDERGLIVSYIEQGGPAASAGMKKGDIVKKVADRPIDDIASLKGAVEAARKEKAEEVVVVVLRGGRETNILRVEPDWTQGE